MIQTSRQLKDLIRNLSVAKSADAQVLMRNYMMERFLERVSVSEYKGSFILKGGMLVAAMVGLEARSTMDMDATIHGKTIDTDEVRKIISDIISVPIADEVTFVIKDISSIMDEAEYPGVRVSMETLFDGVRTPLKIDISTGDVITPRAIEYRFSLMFEERSIGVMAYNLETVLAEKLETVISRSTTNTRMRDFYDLSILRQMYGTDLDRQTLTNALNATAERREHSKLLANAEKILSDVERSVELQRLWKAYQEKFSYAADLSWSSVTCSVRRLALDAGLQVEKPTILAQLQEPIHHTEKSRPARPRRNEPER